MSALGRRSINQAFRRPQFLAPVLLFPSLFLAVNTGGAGAAVNLPGFPEVNGFLDFELGAAMVQSTLLAGLSGGIALALDIEMGFTDRLFAAPVPRSAVVLGRFVATAALGLLTVAWFIAVGLIFGARIESGIPGVLLLVVMVPLAALAFGTIGAALALRSGQASVVQGLFPIVFVILFLSSAFFPDSLMKEPAGTVARYNPISFIAEGVRNPIIASLDAGEIAKGFAGIAIIGGVGSLLSALALRGRLRAG
ncbi:MAG: ABC transporter permease [Thermoleophilaceae bacterium]|nr:ABC transporter permease [Thermoleophilaceae bacterium]